VNRRLGFTILVLRGVHALHSVHACVVLGAAMQSASTEKVHKVERKRLHAEIRTG
jgi:hypothetical protein